MNSLLNKLKAKLETVEQRTVFEPRLKVHGGDELFLRQLEPVAHVYTVLLAWSPITDTANTLVQKYYIPGVDQQICDAIDEGGKSSFKVENMKKIFDCDLQPDNASVSLDISQLEYRPYGNEDISKYLTHVHVFEHCAVGPYGFVFSSELIYTPYMCYPPTLQFPNSTSSFPFYKNIFVLGQNDPGAIFHNRIEDLPRLAPFLNFLISNPDVNVLSPSAGDPFVRNTFQILGINPRRLISGWARASVVYVPRSTLCGLANILEVQLLSSAYISYIDKYLNPGLRNNLVLIRRSRKRRYFLHQEEIERGLQKLCLKHRLEFIVYDWKNLPTFNETLKIFRKARIIVGPHGAGLANMMYSLPGTLVVEGLAEVWSANFCYQLLANQLGMRYFGTVSADGVNAKLDTTAERIVQIVGHHLQNKLVD